MKLTLKEVEHIAQLARLDLTDEEKETYRQQLSAILEHVTSLQELDTSGIAPTSSVLPSRVELREDEPRPGLSTEGVLLNAPAKKKNQFRVPPVLE
jgi:aspartyl-tRNA(Asn)/glutamyl-tRNA(Gln) amidotransferase subunit C